MPRKILYSYGQIINGFKIVEDLKDTYPRRCVFECHCGNTFESDVGRIRRGETTSCGCKNRFRTTNGLRQHRLYNIWAKMNQRTSNKTNKDFVNYGARGIIVCQEWKNDFMSFYNWAMDNGYDESLSIDRINNDGNYEPSNCRWENKFVQTRNSRVIRTTNKSGYRGVSFNKKLNKWACCIRFNGKTKHLGYFVNALDGGIAYNNFVIENKLENTLNPI